jgi:hypothetical protein
MVSHIRRLLVLGLIGLLAALAGVTRVVAIGENAAMSMRAEAPMTVPKPPPPPQNSRQGRASRSMGRDLIP